MRRRCLLSVPLCCVIGACTNSENARLSLDHGLVLEGVNPGRGERIEPLERLPVNENPLRPVATSLDRSSWGSTRVYVPTGDVRHHPSYTDQWIPAYSDRAQGLSPTLLSALDKGDAGLEMGVVEGFATAGLSIFDALAIIPRMVYFDPYWEYNQSPQIGYQRRAMRPWIPLAVAPDADEPRPTELDPDFVPGRIERITPPEQADSSEPETGLPADEMPTEEPPADQPPVGEDASDEPGQEDDPTTDPPGVTTP